MKNLYLLFLCILTCHCYQQNIHPFLPLPAQQPLFAFFPQAESTESNPKGLNFPESEEDLPSEEGQTSWIPAFKGLKALKGPSVAGRTDEGKTEKEGRTLEFSNQISIKNKQILILEKGESMKLLSPAFEKIWLSKGGVISVQDTGSFLNIQARQTGEVLLNLGSRLYLVQVLNAEKKKDLIAVNEFLSNRMGLKARFVKDQIRIQGQLYRIKDFIDLSNTAQALSLNYLFEAEVVPSLRPELNAYIHKKITNLPPPVLLWQKPLTALIPDDKSLTNLYHIKLKNFGIAIKNDPSLLPSPPLIKLKILLVESSANHSFQTHIDWGEKVINRLLDGSLFKQMLSDFKAMEDKGKAHIFSETVLLSESGKKSHFHSGGEVPIPHFNPESGTQSIKWKPYGIQLNFEAKADQNNRIHINTQANISEVDHSHSARSAPSLKSSRIHSSITIRSGQSLLLSKLIRRQRGKSHSAPLMLSRLPLAGPLLSFKGKIKEHTRLSIFITAQIVSQNN